MGIPEMIFKDDQGNEPSHRMDSWFQPFSSIQAVHPTDLVRIIVLLFLYQSMKCAVTLLPLWMKKALKIQEESKLPETNGWP